MAKALGISILALALFGCQPTGREEPTGREPTRPDLRIVPEMCDRVQVGMSATEVQIAIGGPPGFYEGTVGVSYVPGTGPRNYKTDQSWTGRLGTVAVQFDEAGKSTKATWHPAKDIWLR